MTTKILEKYLSDKFPGKVFQSSYGPSVIRIEWDLGVDSKATKVAVQQSLLDLIKAGMTIPIENMMFSVIYSKDRLAKAKKIVLSELEDVFYANNTDIGNGFYSKDSGEYSIEASNRYQWVLDNYEFDDNPTLSDTPTKDENDSVDEVKHKIITFIWSQVCWATKVFDSLGIARVDLYNQIIILSMLDLAGKLEGK